MGYLFVLLGVCTPRKDLCIYNPMKYCKLPERGLRPDNKPLGTIHLSTAPDGTRLPATDAKDVLIRTYRSSHEPSDFQALVEAGEAGGALAALIPHKFASRRRARSLRESCTIHPARESLGADAWEEGKVIDDDGERIAREMGLSDAQ